MIKNSVMILVVGSMGLCLIATSIAKAEDAELTVTQMNSELQQSGVITPDEAAAIQSPLKDMVGKGARKEELQGLVTELSHTGVKGDDLKESVHAMNNLVNEGEDPQVAGSLVSQAARQAHAQGLKGKDLADKVHAVGKEMRAEKRASMETKKEQKEMDTRKEQKQMERVENESRKGASFEERDSGRSMGGRQGRGKK